MRVLFLYILTDICCCLYSTFQIGTTLKGPWWSWAWRKMPVISTMQEVGSRSPAWMKAHDPIWKTSKQNKQKGWECDSSGRALAQLEAMSSIPSTTHKHTQRALGSSGWLLCCYSCLGLFEFVVLKEGLTMYPRLASNLLCNPGWH
jgi:hypothetical protein